MPVRIVVQFPKPPEPDPLPEGTPWAAVLVSRVVTALVWAVALAIVIVALRWAAGG
ncbi:MAG: hypothetical protein ACREOQ_14630 [Gemmatimonadales bacterium]